MQAIWPYWFATFRSQNFFLFYLKFSAEFNNFTLNFEKQQEEKKKMLKTKVVLEMSYMRL